jgi:cyclopropane fatty-acyl-phospholipid synthase-like methyltransferase
MFRLRASLPAAAKKAVWNFKYGILGYSQGAAAPADAIRHLGGHLSERECLLDLGCGRGTLLQALRKSGWPGYYCGVDISRLAIRNAQQFHDQHSSWVVSGAETFRSPFQWDAIVLIESIYYLPIRELSAIMTRLASMLRQGGFILIRLHDFEEHRDYVQVLQRLFPATERVHDKLLCVRLQ